MYAQKLRGALSDLNYIATQSNNCDIDPITRNIQRTIKSTMEKCVPKANTNHMCVHIGMMS